MRQEAALRLGQVPRACRSMGWQHVRQALTSRAIIDQAMAMLMAQHRVSSTAAFELLVGLPQKSNRKLREVAHAIVDSAESF